jgi:hypothetical protein
VSSGGGDEQGGAVSPRPRRCSLLPVTGGVLSARVEVEATSPVALEQLNQIGSEIEEVTYTDSVAVGGARAAEEGDPGCRRRRRRRGRIPYGGAGHTWEDGP